MENEIKRLRQKIVIISSTIVFIVLLAMVIILNVLMSESYRRDKAAAVSTLTESAISSAADYDKEYITLSEMERNADGDYIIPINPLDISSVTLLGSITSSSPTTEWYNAGGGLMFEANTKNGKELVYRKYTFNQGIESVTVDFSDYNNIISDSQPFSGDKAQITGDYLLISDVWWTTSSDMKNGGNPEIKLTLKSAEICYTKPKLLYRDFSDTFLNGIPASISGINGFYILTDENSRLLEINSGNIVSDVSEEMAKEFIQNKKCMIDEAEFICYSSKNGNIIAYVFITDNNDSSVHRLIIISSSLGIVIFIILTIAIYILSGMIVKPVAENFESQKQFISNASHELKTPITVLSATADIMEQKGIESKWVDCIKVQSCKMKALVSEMLELTKLSEIQTDTDDFTEFDFSQCVSNTVLYFESRAYEAKKQLSMQIKENICMQGDERKIERLIGIFIDNALKYSDDDSTIEIKAYEEKDEICFICENLCSNFKENEIHLLFERFYRGDEAHSDECEGYGLGLPIAQKIVMMHNGKIEVSYNNAKVVFMVKLKAIS